MASFQTLGDALSASFVPDEAELRDVAAPVAMQTVISAERLARRGCALGMSEAMVKTAQAAALQRVYIGSQWCDSPIEKRLLPWLLTQDYGDKVLSFPAQIHNPLKELEKPAGDVVVIPQFRFAKYRMDFAVVTFVGALRIVCVECDGENEHTAEHDNPRDAYLLSWGIPTIRATGKEIYAQPAAVAQRVGVAVLEQLEAA